MRAQDIDNALSGLPRRRSNAGTTVSEVMIAMTTLPSLPSAQHQSIFITSLKNMIDSLLMFCDDKDVSLCQTVNVVLTAPVQ
jgi:hypothetical protein